MRLHSFKNRILSVILAVCLTLSLSPIAVSAQEIPLGTSQATVDSGSPSGTEAEKTQLPIASPSDSGLPKGNVMPMATDSECAIGGTEYPTLAAALAAVSKEQTVTIKLLKDINYNGGISIDAGENKKITFDLNGFTLNVVNSGGAGIATTTGSSIDYVDVTSSPGRFNVTGRECGVWAWFDTGVRVSNATATAPSTNNDAYSYGAYARYGALITVTENARGNKYGAYADDAYGGKKSKVTVGGDAIAENDYNALNPRVGAIATNYADIEVTGNVSGGYHGVYAGSNSTAKVGGNATGGMYGAYAGGNSTTEVMGNAVATADYGAAAYNLDNNSSVIVKGNAIANLTNGIGAIAIEGHITIDGVITAPVYIRTGTTDKSAGDYTTDSAKPAYRKYTDGLGTVWVKETTAIVLAAVETDQAADVTSAGATLSGNVTSDGGAAVSERGFVYSTSADPTTANGTKVTSGSGTGSFTGVISGLTANTTYNVRAYAINSEGTAYGANVKLTTLPAVPSKYTVTVNSGTGGGSYMKDATVTITANAAPGGQRFKEWSITPSVTFVEGTDKTNSTAKFMMPEQAVTATAAFEPLPASVYSITVQNDGNGTAAANVNSAAQGTEITLTTTPSSGYRFKEWQVVSGGVTIANNKFSMPGTNVTVKGIFEQIPPVYFSVTVRGSYAGTTGTGSYAEGATVTIDAGSRSGYSFTGWTSSDGVTFIGANNATATFTMPAKNVTVTATWSYNGGSGNDGGTSGGSGTGNPSPGGNYVPDENIVVVPNRVTVTLPSSTTLFSAAQINGMIGQNQTKPIIIGGSGYTITFPTGTMAGKRGNRDYDLSMGFNQGTNYGVIQSLAGKDFVLMMNFNHSGDLPGQAEIRIKVGTEYAGQTLEYYYYNPQAGRLEFRQTVTVDRDGYATVTQSRCSQYVFVKANLENALPKEPENTRAERIYGESRYDTAVEIAKAYFAKGAETVILTRGDVSADALPAVPLAKQYNAPLLLTPPDGLPENVLAEIRALGAKKVIIVGGPGAVKAAVEEKLKADGFQVERIYGQTHYDTAYEIARRLGGNNSQAILVNGNNYEETFADALSVSAWAGYNGIPILYVDSSRDVLPEGTAKALSELKVSHTLLIGGTAVIPFRLEGLVPQAERYGGQSLYDTNVQVLKNLQPNSETIYAVTGGDFADALAGAAVAAQNNSWLVLTGGTSNGLTMEQENLLKGMKGRIRDFHVFGGPAVVTKTTLEGIKALLGKGAGVYMPMAWDELDTVALDGVNMAEARSGIGGNDPWQDFFRNHQQLK